MGPIFALSLRQLSGRWRLLIILFLTSLPIIITVIVRIVGTDIPEEFTEIMLDGMIVAAILPIVTMTLATAAFGNELEDRTLAYLVLKPVPRSYVVLPKMMASLVIAAPLLIVSGVVVAVMAIEGGPRTALAVVAALLAGVAAYSAIFTWAGLISKHALGLALVYVFLWEGIIGTYLEGIRYLSVRGYTLAIMYGIDGVKLEPFKDLAIEFPAAIGGAVAVTAGFFLLAVRRLRRMDVP